MPAGVPAGFYGARIGAASQAFVGCNHGAGTLNVFMNQDLDAVAIARGGDAINVIGGDLFGEGPNILLACQGGSATVDNTDRIVVEEATASIFTLLLVDLSAGPLSPGLTPEADGTSEIELQANMFGRLSFVGIGGTPGSDFFHLGRAASGATGINLNAGAEAAADVDLELTQAELVTLGAGLGNDVIRGRGSPEFAGPVGGRTAMLAGGGAGRDELIAGTSSLLSGGRGNDRVLGSRFGDFLFGDRGRDLIKAGRGLDVVLAARGGRDRINCGAGRRDRAITDRKDHVGNCERERFRRRGSPGPPGVVTPASARSLSRALQSDPLRPEVLDLALDLLKRK